MKLVKVTNREMGHSEYWSPDYHHPYNDESPTFRDWVKGHLGEDAVMEDISIGNEGEWLNDDIGFLADRFAAACIDDFFDTDTWLANSNMIAQTARRVAESGVQTGIQIDGHAILFTPLSEIPPIVEESLIQYGPYASEMIRRVAAIDTSRKPRSFMDRLRSAIREFNRK